MTGSAIPSKPLTDLGGVPVLWDSDLGTLVQDPAHGGTNTYGPGDVFRDPVTGELYQLHVGGSLSAFAAAVPTEHAEAHARLTRISVDLVWIALGLVLLTAVNLAFTLYDVFLRVGGRFPWQ